MRGLVSDFKKYHGKNPLGGDAAAREKHISRGKMLPRERCTSCSTRLALPRDRPARSLGMYGGDVHSASMICGIGRISGRECVVVANDATIKGGTYYPMTVKKHCARRRSRRRTACVHLPRRLGRRLPAGAGQRLPDREHFGRIFFNIANMSAAGIPQIACVMGSCTAGGAYVPAMSDESIIVKGQGTIFLGGPPLVKRRPARSSRPRSSAARRCIRASPAWRTTTRSTMPCFVFGLERSLKI